MAMSKTLRRLGVALGLVVGIGSLGSAEAQDNTQQVVVLDECDPTTFNGQFGPGTCLNVVSGGGRDALGVSGGITVGPSGLAILSP